MKFTEDNFINILDALYDGLYITDLERKIIFWNKAAEKITGFSSEEVVGTHCSDNILVHIDDTGRNLCFGSCPLAFAIQNSSSEEAPVYLHHKNGQRVPVIVKVCPLYDDAGKIIGAVELFSDNSKQKKDEVKLKELEELALLDALTRIPNRLFLENQLRAAFEEIKRFHIPFGFIFLDIDNFKTLNDCYGHISGDQVLKFVASTIQNVIRPFDTASRWGGDEFAIILHNVTQQTVSEIADRIRVLIKNSYYLKDNKRISVTISLGGTIIQENDTIESLIARADNLLYNSKKSGKNYITVS